MLNLKGLADFQFPVIIYINTHVTAVQFSCSVVSNLLWCHGLRHARLPCPSPAPGAYSNSLSRWCHPTISPSVVPSSSCLQSCLARGSFQMSQLFTLGGQHCSFSFNISPSNEHPGLISFTMDWLHLLAVQGTLKSLHSSKVLLGNFKSGPLLCVFFPKIIYVPLENEKRRRKMNTPIPIAL